jgi:hypothetical protein
MKRAPLQRRTKLRARKQLQRTTGLQRTPAMAASESQRAAVAGHTCVVCGTDRRVDPAHLIPRSLGGCGDRLCVVPACRAHHRAYDRGSWICCRTWSRRGGRRSPMRSGTLG